MSISISTNKVSYTCNESTTTFEITFDVTLDSSGDAENIGVIHRNASAEETVLTKGVDWTISGTTVTIAAASGWTADEKVVLYRDSAWTQPVDLRNNDAMDAEVLERALDRVTCMVQQIREEMDRSVKIPISDNATTLTIPTAENRALKALCFDGDGDIEMYPSPPPRTYSSIYIYAVGDICQYGGYLFKALQESKGNTPDSATPGDTAYWELFKIEDLDTSHIDNEITAVQTNLEAEHNAAGVHNEGSARIFVQNTEPSGDYAREGAVWYNPDTGEISYYNTGWETSLGSGTTVEAGEDIDAGEAAYISTDGKAYLADLDGEASSVVAGIAVAAATAGNDVVLQKSGLCAVFSGLTPGQAYFLGESGAIVAGTGSYTQNQYRTFIGVAQAADTIDLNVAPPISVQYVDAMPIGTTLPFMGAGGSVPAGYVAMEGQTLNRHVYKELDNVCYVGDGNNATAESFYRTSDEAGTIRSTTGDWLVIPDSRGAVIRFTGTNGGAKKKANGDAYVGPDIGAFELDQMQGHKVFFSHKTFSADGTTKSIEAELRTALEGIAGTGYTPTIIKPSIISDGTNGDPRTGDETRQFSMGATAMLKVSRVTPTGEAISALMYDTGWIANSDWTDAEFTVTHNLGANLSELIVKFFISTDGTEANALEIIDNSLNATDDVYRAYGLSVHHSNMNVLTIETTTNGVRYIDASNVQQVLGDASPAYYKVVVYKPAVLVRVAHGAIRSVSADYTINDLDADIIEVTTGATDRTITLPTLVDNIGRKIKVVRVDSGAGKVIVDGEGAETIDGVTTIDIDSQYDMAILEAGATCWNLEQYKDHGSNAYGSWERFADGTMRQWGKDTPASSLNITNKDIGTYGWSYYVGVITVTFPHTFVGDLPDISATAYSETTTNCPSASIDSLTLSGCRAIQYDDGSVPLAIQWRATGRWRA